MKRLACLTLALVGVTFSTVTGSEEFENEEASREISEAQADHAIARKVENGVEVRINQLQIQRIGADILVAHGLDRLGVDVDQFSRTIALSISQRGQGTSTGPLHITLNNGEVLNPTLMGNSQFMSALANASIPDGFDSMESWFKLSEDIEFAEIFPIVVTFESTTEDEQPVTFVFEDITP